MSPRLLRPRAAGGFNPKTIPGLVGWWDASDSSTITLNSGNVSEWRDKSASGNALAQSTAANQPAYVQSSLNGKAGIDWGSTQGNAKRLGKASTSVAISDHYVVADWDGGASFTSYSGLVTTTGFLAGEILGGGNTWYASNLWSRLSINGAASAVTALPTVSSPFLIRATLVTSGTATAIQVGQWQTLTTRGWAGKIYEVLLFSSELSSGNDTAIKRYIAAKWGLTIA
jgi:hypothetical protein